MKYSSYILIFFTLLVVCAFAQGGYVGYSRRGDSKYETKNIMYSDLKKDEKNGNGIHDYDKYDNKKSDDNKKSNDKYGKDKRRKSKDYDNKKDDSKKGDDKKDDSKKDNDKKDDKYDYKKDEKEKDDTKIYDYKEYSDKKGDDKKHDKRNYEANYADTLAYYNQMNTQLQEDYFRRRRAYEIAYRRRYSLP
ncbi:hypothetical protein BDF14DRAFT_1804158 [Spinellus fusiger]|nr:hypothetical protein BDF14DRAFT_1804158 [Spinellus fusiger]